MAAFWVRVDKSAPDGHWLWTGSVDGGGYGQVGQRRSPVASGGRRAHRIAWELTNGPIPHDLVMDHVCRVKLCVRPHPEHLEPVTQAENIRRGMLGVLHVPKPRPAPILKPGQRAVDTAALLARLTELGMSKRDLAERAPMAYSYVNFIIRGTHQPSWRIARDMAAALKWDVEQLYVADTEAAA